MYESRTYVHSKKGKFSYIEKVLYKNQGVGESPTPFFWQYKGVVKRDTHLIEQNWVLLRV